jgi:hypothetical protein
MCSVRGVHQDGGSYVQDHTEHDKSLHVRRNPPDGGYERNRSQKKSPGRRDNPAGTIQEFAMMIDKEQETRAQGMSLEVAWRNPLPHLRAHLRSRQENSPYCRWAEQAGKIRARRFNWDANHIWIE